MSIEQIKNTIAPRYILRLVNTTRNCTAEEAQTRISLFIEQVIDSCIVGGIGGFSTYISAGEDATLKGFVVAFSLAFLFKMKEYRKIK